MPRVVLAFVGCLLIIGADPGASRTQSTFPVASVADARDHPVEPSGFDAVEIDQSGCPDWAVSSETSNALGRQVPVLARERQSAGRKTVRLAAAGLPGNL